MRLPSKPSVNGNLSQAPKVGAMSHAGCRHPFLFLFEFLSGADQPDALPITPWVGEEEEEGAVRAALFLPRGPFSPLLKASVLRLFFLPPSFEFRGGSLWLRRDS